MVSSVTLPRHYSLPNHVKLFMIPIIQDLNCLKRESANSTFFDLEGSRTSNLSLTPLAIRLTHGHVNDNRETMADFGPACSKPSITGCCQYCFVPDKTVQRATIL